MPPPSPRPRARRTTPTRLLLLLGVFWIALCWSYALFSLWSSLPHHAAAPGEASLRSPPRASPLSSAAGTGGTAGASGKQNRHLSSSPGNATTGRDRGHQMTGKDEPHYPSANEPGTARPNRSSAPLAPFVYPLHARSGTHHAYLYVGTPPQRQTLIVDTGSRLTAFPCRPHCPDCGTHASAPFALNASSSHEVVPCDACQLNRADVELEDYFDAGGTGGNSADDGPPGGLRGEQQKKRRLFPKSCVDNRCGLDQRYTEGSSWKAFEVRDEVWLGSDSETSSGRDHAAHSSPHVFGCQVAETGLFKTQYADGIMGMSMYTRTLVGAWTRRGSIPGPSFSLCLNRRGGHIALGGVGSSYDFSSPSEGGRRRQEQQYEESAGGRLLAPMRFTPFAKQNVWYYTVRVTSISVGDHVLPKRVLQFVNDHKGTIVDSGTTDTFITQKVATPFILAWERITGRKYNNRLQKYTFEQFDQLPIITFELDGGVSWEITPEAYMEKEEAASSDAASPENGAKNNNNETAANNNNADPNDDGDGGSRQRRWEGKRGFISRVYVDEPQGVVLGSNAMMDKEIYFDIPNRRLGVARATCAY